VDRMHCVAVQHSATAMKAWCNRRELKEAGAINDMAEFTTINCVKFTALQCFRHQNMNVLARSLRA